MGVALTTAGVKFRYAVETEKDVRPTTGYTEIPDITSTPNFNVSPSKLPTTTLAATRYATSTEGLKELEVLEFEANHTEELADTWSELVEAYETAKAAGKSVWFEVDHPKLEESMCFTGIPSTMGLGAMSVDEVLKTTLYVTCTNEPDWYTKSTN